MTDLQNWRSNRLNLFAWYTILSGPGVVHEDSYVVANYYIDAFLNLTPGKQCTQRKFMREGKEIGHLPIEFCVSGPTKVIIPLKSLRMLEWLKTVFMNQNCRISPQIAQITMD